MAYTKLFQKILASSIWNEDVYTKVVWITMLAMKDQDQIVSASVGGLAHIARVPIEECRKALATLEGPDADDSSGVREGRRIEPLEHGGWIVINGKAYRDSKDEDERRAYMANYMRDYRKRKQNVNNRKGSLMPVNPSEQSRALQPNGCSPSGEKRLRSATPEFWESLKSDPAFEGVDFEEERRKMAIWRKIAKNKHRQITERFVLNWLSKADRNVDLPNLNRSCL